MRENLIFITDFGRAIRDVTRNFLRVSTLNESQNGKGAERNVIKDEMMNTYVEPGMGS